MSGKFHITLLRLKADLSAVDPASESVDVGAVSAKEFFRLAALLLKLSPPLASNAAMIVRIDGKGWRVVAHEGQLRVHRGSSAFEDYWTIPNVAGLADLAPFAIEAEAETAEKSTALAGLIGSGLKVFVILGLGLAVMGVSLWFGIPHRKVRTVPSDLTLLTAVEDQVKVFHSMAGTYISGRNPGDAAVTIQPDGSVWLGTIGRDGKIVRPPRISEEAQAGRRQNLYCVVTTFGIFASADADSVSVGSASWRKAQIN